MPAQTEKSQLKRGRVRAELLGAYPRWNHMLTGQLLAIPRRANRPQEAAPWPVVAATQSSQARTPAFASNAQGVDRIR